MKMACFMALAVIVTAQTGCGDDGGGEGGDDAAATAATTTTATAGTTSTTTGGGGEGGAGKGGASSSGSGGEGGAGGSGAGGGGGSAACGVPAVLGSVAMEPGEEAFDVALEGDVLYVTLESDGVRAFDVADPTQPMARGILDLSNAKRIEVEDGVAYVTELGAGFAAVDFGDLDAPVLIGEPLANGRTFYDVVRHEGRSLLATDGLVVANDTDGGPEVVTLVDEGGGRALALSGSTLLAPFSIFGLNAYDVADVDAPVLVATLDENVSMEAIDVRGGIALVGGVDTGVVRVDVTDVEAMAITGTAGEHTVRDVRFVRDGIALVAADAEGVLVVDASTTEPVVLATIPTDGDANGIAVGDGLVAIAVAGGGVLLVDPCPAP